MACNIIFTSRCMWKKAFSFHLYKVHIIGTSLYASGLIKWALKLNISTKTHVKEYILIGFLLLSSMHLKRPIIPKLKDRIFPMFDIITLIFLIGVVQILFSIWQKNCWCINNLLFQKTSYWFSQCYSNC